MFLRIKFEKIEVENTDSVVENKIEQVEYEIKQAEHAVEPEIKPAKGEPLPVYVAKDKIVCDLCGKRYAKAGIAKYRKLCLSKNKIEVPESNNTKETSIAVVPVEPEVQPPPPPPLERHTNKAYLVESSAKEALHEVEPDTREADDYEKAVKKKKTPVVAQTLKPLPRVAKLRMMARNGLP